MIKPPLLWRIDLDEFSANFRTMQTNLARLFTPTKGDERRRRLLVDLDPPRFRPLETINLLEMCAPSF
jgi:hypothetical protein